MSPTSSERNQHLARLTAARFELGEPTAPTQPVSGGLLNHMWRIETTSGSYAVKELNLGRDWPCDFDAVLAVEQAAYRAGISMPQPIPNPITGRAVAELESVGSHVIVHRWIDGQPVPNRPVPPHFAAKLGSQLAVLHRLDLPWPTPPRVPSFPAVEEWAMLASEAANTGFRWADELAVAAPILGEIGTAVGSWQRPSGRVRVSHRDAGQKNLLNREDTPVLLDWETAGPVPVAHELGSLCVDLSTGERLEMLKDPVVEAFLGGYRQAGGEVPTPGPDWLAMWFSNWTLFLGWNVRRCLSDTSSGGPPPDVAHRTISRGLRELKWTWSQRHHLSESLTRAVYNTNSSVP